jgi:hypothetical protein
LISDPEDRSDRILVISLSLAALFVGVVVAWLYYRQGLTLSHYDAKAHLVVARRILDSRTPGWLQVGAVWLPLPHLLNALPVQNDWLYRTGLSAVAISIAAFVLTIYAASRLVFEVTGSRIGTMTAAVALVANPNLLYLQATPMTEPLLLGFGMLSVWLTYRWARMGGVRHPHAAGWSFVAVCLTRYEGWLIAAACIVASAFALWRAGLPVPTLLRRMARLAAYPVIAILAFAVHSRFTIGQWMVTGGFFVPDNIALDRPHRAVGQIFWGTHRLGGYLLTIAGMASAAFLIARGLRTRAHAHLLVVLALAASAVLPFYAFLEGHPFRIRYMTPLVAATAAWAGIGIGFLPRLQLAAAMVLIAIATFEAPPLDRRAPMVIEAQLDLPNSLGRQTVTACLTSHYRGEPILMSMGSLAHYMQELSIEGFSIRDFVHEGNHPEWENAVKTPQGRVGWILIEEQAEGGDVLSARARQDPTFLNGFDRICSGGGVALHEAKADLRLLALGLQPNDVEHLLMQMPVRRDDVGSVR